MEKEQPLSLEQLTIGDCWLTTPRVVLHEDVIEFAERTGDRDPLHLDPEYAARTPFRRQIAHGLLGLSFMAGLSSSAPSVRTTALVRIDDWHFVQPIFIGDSIHVINKIVDIRPHGRKNGEVHWFRQILNQHGQIVQQGILVTLVARETVRRIRTDQAEPVLAQAPSPPTLGASAYGQAAAESSVHPSPRE